MGVFNPKSDWIVQIYPIIILSDKEEYMHSFGMCDSIYYQNLIYLRFYNKF